MERYAPTARISRAATSSRRPSRPRSTRGADQRLRLPRPDALGAERILTRLPGSRELATVYAGIDPIDEPIPVRPGAHYHMGGVETDTDGLTELTGLYAAGEVACVSVHGVTCSAATR